MERKLEVILTQTFDQRPLTTVSNLPGQYADLTPAQLRALAAALYMAARECEAQPMDPKHFRQKERSYELADQPIGKGGGKDRASND